MARPEHTVTIDDFINSKPSDPMTYYNLSILSKSITDDGIIYSSDNVIYTYLEELQAECQTVKLSDDEYLEYRYKPKLVSYRIYGTTELYFVLMGVNGICNIKDFDFHQFKALTPVDMQTLLNTIYIAEQDRIRRNRESVGV